MSASRSRSDEMLPNGAAAAAILATGIGCAMLGILAFTADASSAVGKMLNFYNPTGTLSGVTTVAILVWLVAWLVLNKLWRARRYQHSLSTVPHLCCLRGASC